MAITSPPQRKRGKEVFWFSLRVLSSSVVESFRPRPYEKKGHHPFADDGPFLSRFRPISSADPLAFDDKGDNDRNSNDADNDPQSYTPRGHTIE